MASRSRHTQSKRFGRSHQWLSGASFPTLGPVKRSGTFRFHLLALGALCATTFFVGLTTHGLTNWQEAQRALVARDMAARGEWLVPTVNGEPYLAKPPMIYWAQIALARIRGSEPGEIDLRLTVALAASLGVFATYFAGRRILASALPAEADPATARLGAFWAAAMLATGTLYVRSGRIGELDILLVPFVVVAVGWVWGAGEGKRAEIRDQRSGGGGEVAGAAALAGAESPGRRVAAGALFSVLCSLFSALPAAIAATGAALTKGPPGVLVIALAAYFPAVLIHHRGTEKGLGLGGRQDGDPRREAPTRGSLCALCASVVKKRPLPTLGAALGLAGAVLATVFISGPPRSVGERAGVVILAAGLGWLGWVLGRADWGRVLREWSVTHPVVVLGLPLLALWGWGKLVGARIGPEAVARAAGQEASENLRLWVLESPLRTLEGASYGVGLGSVMAIITALWLIRFRPRLGPGAAAIMGWTVVSLLAFAALGKGPARYLTPMWPGIALAGGLGVALAAGKLKAESSKLKSGRGAGGALPHFSFQLSAFSFSSLRILLAVIVCLLALGQGLWYGYGREALYAWRSPRALIAEIMRPEINPEQRPPIALDIWTPALDYYVGRHVQPYFTEGAPSVALAGVRPRPLHALRAELQALADAGESPWRIMLIRTTPHPEGPDIPPTERLERAGLMVQTLPPPLITSQFRIDNNRTEVVPVRVAPAP